MGNRGNCIRRRVAPKKINRVTSQQSRPKWNAELPNISFTGTNILFLMQQDLEKAKHVLNHPDITVNTTAEAVDYLCHYPVGQFLGIHRHKSFRCLFHSDHYASASIFQSSVTGDYLYSCNGACNCTWDIIGLVKHKLRCSYSIALNHLLYVFNIHVLFPDPKQKPIPYETQLQQNKKALQDLSNHPAIAKLLIGNYTQQSPMSIMLFLTEYAAELHQHRQDIRDSLTYRPIFYVSVREMTRKLLDDLSAEQPLPKISGKLTLLSYLGLLERIPNRELPAAALDLASRPEYDYRHNNHERFKNAHGNRISFYHIPYYNEYRINYAKEAAQRWLDLGYSLKNISYQRVLETEGKIVADRLFAGRQIKPKKSKKKKQLRQPP